MGSFRGAGPALFMLAVIVFGVEDCKAKAYAKDTWCRFTGNLNCGNYKILCNGHGFIDCNGKDNDKGFWNVVQFLTNPVLTKIFKTKMKQPPGATGRQTIEKLLNSLLNEEDMQDVDSDGFLSFFSDENTNNNINLVPSITESQLTEELVTITNSKLFSKDTRSYDSQLDTVGTGSLESLHLLEGNRKSTNMEDERDSIFYPPVDYYKQNKDDGPRLEITKFETKNKAAFSSEKLDELFSLLEQEKTNTTLVDVSNNSQSLWDFTPEQNDKENIKLNSGEETFSLVKILRNHTMTAEENVSSGATTRSDELEDKVDKPVSKTKRSIYLLPQETHTSRNGGYAKSPVDRFRPIPLKHRPYRKKGSIFELQRRLERILDTLKTFRKAHSVKTGQVTTEVALKILASDILHKLHSTSRRVTRDASSLLNSNNGYIVGGPGTGTCRVFNMTCLELPPLSACSGAGLGGCIS
ncbi:uncharacterized protein LOC135220505 [Macrobrachium nipponense]|uniref:uncharacterized protein LOC135220505 n=1 Tax=Macrobrachium nipponense TaxID=159736 RepID=UPI0030C86B69